MKNTFPLPLTLLATAIVTIAQGQTPITPSELVGPKVEISEGTIYFTVQSSVVGRRYQLQGSDTLSNGMYLGPERIGDGNMLVISTPYDPAVQQHFYWLVLDGPPPAPAGFSLIPAGSFQMGDQSSPLVGIYELPVHSVFVSSFYMGQTEVTKAQWDEVRVWGKTHGYTDLLVGGGKASNHPVHTINWYSIVKWCNARSEKESLTPCYRVGGATYKAGQNDAVICDFTKNGYRLPTEAEWEKAARGGLIAQNFPWGNNISHSQANYLVYSENGSTNFYSYDISPTRGPHPTYAVGVYPYTSPVGSFAANGYGLYDMAGNVWEWCWDWYGDYPAASQTDPLGPASGSYRVFRGGGWLDHAFYCRAALRGFNFLPANTGITIGFRLARSSVP